MRISLLGTRGIPARYGGFETFAEEISTRLVARGHHVTVYCRTQKAAQGAPPAAPRHPEPFYRGVRLVYLPTIRHKYFDTLAHTFLSTLHLLFYRADRVLYCNGANAVFTLLPRLFGMPVALNVDGIERLRKKWNRLAKAWYLLSEWLATLFPTVIITDARTIQDYYQRRYHKPSTFIPYGAEILATAGRAALDRLALEPGGYFLYVSRLEPENHPLEVRQAFETLDTQMKLALVGDAPYAVDYIRRVRATTDPRVLLPGAIYGEGYRELGFHCFAYIHATEVGGTHPALIEAMGRGNLVLYRDTPENAEVAAGAGIPFTPSDLAEKMQSVLAMSESGRQALRRKAAARAAALYSWDAVTTAYERLLSSL